MIYFIDIFYQKKYNINEKRKGIVMKKIISIFTIIFTLLLIVSCNNKEEKAMTHQEYLDAPISSTVIVEAYIQAKQSWWESDGIGVASFYLQDQDGGYFAYNLPCSKQAYDKDLTIGTKIRIKGQKIKWADEIEIDGLSSGAEATYEILSEKKFIATPKDVTNLISSDDLILNQNMLVEFKQLTVVAQENGSAFYYKWDNSGSRGDDLYVSLTDGTNTISAVVESYLCDENSTVYKAVEELNVGDVINVEAFLYWYNGAQPHITKITKTN